VTHEFKDNISDLELSREDGIKSVLTLINLIPDPAVIYQREEDRIIVANNALFLLTQLEEKDFIQKDLSSLLPKLTNTDPITGHNKQTFLRHADQPLISVNIRIFSLDQIQGNLLLIFKPQQAAPAMPEKQSQKLDFLQKLSEIMRIRDGDSLQTNLSQVLDESAKLLKAEILSIYKASGTAPQLLHYLSNQMPMKENLPSRLSSEDLSLSDQPSLWKKHDPPLSHLQRAASRAGLYYLVTVPLGQVSAKFGLFVVGSREKPHSSNTLDLSKVIAAHITGMMQDQIAINNLRNLANKIKQVVKIQSEIISNLDEGVIILSPDLTVAEMNPAAESILGYANVEAIRQHIDTILIGSESLGSAFSSAQQGIPTVTSSDLTLHHRNGNSFPAQLMVAPVRMNDQVLSIIVLVRDMSEAEQSQSARKQLEQRAILGEVMAIFAHEVRNPINAIMLSLQVMEENLTDGDENQKWIDNVREECKKLLYLMESVLSFAKPLEYKMTDVNLDEMLNRLIERWRTRLLKLKITPYYESELENPIVEGDPRALEQVFTNLISNSVNAMDDTGGSLGLKISQPDSPEDQTFLQIIMTDSGHGIPDEIKSHMFKPFVTGSAHGTGLGLAITQRIINAHKGKIEVDSFTGGTIFKIFLRKKKGLQTK
jgi:two-component system, NtrC family, sensor histidine kinase AtoS